MCLHAKFTVFEEKVVQLAKVRSSLNLQASLSSEAGRMKFTFPKCVVIPMYRWKFFTTSPWFKCFH
jgi:hypothetical protein